jgi:urocanate hydratase
MRCMTVSELADRVRKACSAGEVVSLAYQGNIVELWEKFADEGLWADLGSDQTSLHNPVGRRLLPCRDQL